MKWFFSLWLVFLLSAIAGQKFGNAIGGIIFLGALILFVIILIPGVKFKISTSILTLPYIGKFAFKHGLKNFKPSSEPDGFREIKWGTNISTLGEDMKHQYDLKEYGFVGVEAYTRTGDVLTLGRAELKGIEYAFVGKKFSSVIINTKDFENWNRLKQATFEKFGKGFQSDISKEEYEWKGKATRVALSYDETFGKATLFIASKSYLKQAMKQKVTAGF